MSRSAIALSGRITGIAAANMDMMVSELDQRKLIDYMMSCGASKTIKESCDDCGLSYRDVVTTRISGLFPDFDEALKRLYLESLDYANERIKSKLHVALDNDMEVKDLKAAAEIVKILKDQTILPALNVHKNVSEPVDTEYARTAHEYERSEGPKQIPDDAIDYPTGQPGIPSTSVLSPPGIPVLDDDDDDLLIEAGKTGRPPEIV